MTGVRLEKGAALPLTLIIALQLVSGGRQQMQGVNGHLVIREPPPELRERIHPRQPFATPDQGNRPVVMHLGQ